MKYPRIWIAVHANLTSSEIALDRTTPPSVLRLLAAAKSTGHRAREFIARNPNTPSGALVEMVEMVERPKGINVENLLRIIARNRNTPLATLEKLANDPSPQIHVGLVQNPATPVKLFEKLFRETTSLYLQAKMAVSPYTPDHLLLQLAAHEKKVVSDRARREIERRGLNK